MDAKNGFSQKTSMKSLHTLRPSKYRLVVIAEGACLLASRQVFQRKIYEPNEGMSGNEVVADDLIAIAYSDTFQKATQDHDKNLLPFLKRCKLNVRLNLEKLMLRVSSTFADKSDREQNNIFLLQEQHENFVAAVRK